MRLFILPTIILLLGMPSLVARDFGKLPEVRGQRLSDKKETALSGLAAGQPRLLMLAFSSAGGDKVRSLAYAIREDHPAEALPLVQVVGLARVPSFFRGMAKRSIRKDIPEDRHNHVLVIDEEDQETVLRQAFDVEGDDSAYVVGVDSSGSVIGVLRAADSGETAGVESLITRLQ